MRILFAIALIPSPFTAASGNPSSPASKTGKKYCKDDTAIVMVDVKPMPIVDRPNYTVLCYGPLSWLTRKTELEGRLQ